MQAKLENGAMVVTFTVAELYDRIVKYVSENDENVDYMCPFIGAWGLAKIKKKAFSTFTTHQYSELLIQSVDRGDSANLCLKIIAGSGCSQKYVAGYRAYLRIADDVQFKVVNGVVINTGDQYEGGHTCIDHIPGWGTTNYASAKNFFQRVVDFGRTQIWDGFDRDTAFRIGLLKMNMDNGNGDELITMRYQCDEGNNFLRVENY